MARRAPLRRGGGALRLPLLTRDLALRLPLLMRDLADLALLSPGLLLLPVQYDGAISVGVARGPCCET